ncbi:MAG: polyhydroxyalkanoic acid system family protein [Acidobacteria bacterium]|nr:polyhydroxyalkanoic acid system family protein [Acidobacteriota bacterium]
MADMNLEAATSKASMDDLRTDLEAALRQEFPGGMMRWTWEADILKLSGPGAEGTVILEAGRLVAVATLRPPASLMQPIIRQKMTKVLEKAAG